MNAHVSKIKIGKGYGVIPRFLDILNQEYFYFPHLEGDMSPLSLSSHRYWLIKLSELLHNVHKMDIISTNLLISIKLSKLIIKRWMYQKSKFKFINISAKECQNNLIRVKGITQYLIPNCKVYSNIWICLSVK